MDKHFLQPTGLNQTGEYHSQTFDEYLSNVRVDMMKAKAFLGADAERLAEMNAPFALHPEHPSTIGILLIHGLLDSPFIMRDLAQYFCAQGLHVYVILLPGHGTVPGDLLNIHYAAWSKSVQYGIRCLRQASVKMLYLCGASTGALLAIEAALTDDHIAGIILLSPAHKIKSKFACFLNWYKAIRWAIPSTQWLVQFPENDAAKYKSTPINAAYQVYALGKKLKRRLTQQKLTAPMLMVLSVDDETIDVTAAIDFFMASKHPDNHLLLFANDPYPTKTDNIEWISAAVADENITSLSHVCLPVAPDNPHYGRNGEYTQLCKGALKSPQAHFGAINDAEKLWRDYKTKYKLPKHALYRLHYNPHFEAMTQRIGDFLEKTKLTKKFINAS